MPYKLPDPSWSREKKFKYAVERLKAESTRDYETTVDYWLAGVMINDIRKDRKAKREWVAYLAANGLTRTHAHHAAQIATAFKSPEELAGLTKTAARSVAAVKIRQDREEARLAKGLPPKPPRPVRLVRSVKVTPENAWAILKQAAELMEASAMEARNTTPDPEVMKDVARALREVLEHLEPLSPKIKAAPTSKPKRIYPSGAEKRARKVARAAEQEKAVDPGNPAGRPQYEDGRGGAQPRRDPDQGVNQDQEELPPGRCRPHALIEFYTPPPGHPRYRS